MTSSHAVKFLYQLAKIIFIYLLANGFYILPNSFVIADLLISPSWNVSDVSQPCILQTKVNENLTIVRNSGGDICNLEVIATSRSKTSVGILDGSYVDTFLIVIERLGNQLECLNRIVVINSDSVQSNCTVAFKNDHLRIQIQGDVSIFLRESLDAESVYLEQQCPEHGKRDAEFEGATWMCMEVKGYDKIIACDKTVTPNQEYTSHCNFIRSCNSSLQRNQVYFQCNNDSNQLQNAYLSYKHDVKELYLSENQMVSISDNAFHNLPQLQVLHLESNYLVSLPVGVFKDLANLTLLRLDDNQLRDLYVGVFTGLESLSQLHLYRNYLQTLQTGLFDKLHNLHALFVFENEINIVGDHVFNDLWNLEVLGLADNKIQHLDRTVFTNLTKLKVLALRSNLIKRIDLNIFRNAIHLEVVYLNFNAFMNIPDTIFNHTRNLYFIDLSHNKLNQIPNIQYLHSLRFISINGNPLTQVNKETFSRVPRHTEFYVSQHEVCECFVKDFVNCSAADKRSPFLTCERLLSDRVLVAMMWLIGINALAGNIFVLILKNKSSETKAVQDLFLSNLALSDLMMGIYMIVIASADIYFGENFPMRAETWRSGITCKVAGALSIMSSEASVFFVTLISVDRFINIRFPYSDKQINKSLAIILIIFTWLVALGLGIVPSVMAGLNYKFYDNSHVCIGLPLALIDQYSSVQIEEIVNFETFYLRRFVVNTTYDGKVQGLYFSTAVFLGLNGVCYLIIFVSYVEIIRAVRLSSKRIGRTPEMKKQIRLAASVAAIVATDFCCWFPVILLGVLVQLRLITLPPSVFAWSVTFVLPINSAINPYLYTIAAAISKYRKSHDNMRKSLSSQGKCDSQASELRTSVSQLM